MREVKLQLNVVKFAYYFVKNVVVFHLVCIIHIHITVFQTHYVCYCDIPLSIQCTECSAVLNNPVSKVMLGK